MKLTENKIRGIIRESLSFLLFESYELFRQEPYLKITTPKKFGFKNNIVKKDNLFRKQKRIKGKIKYYDFKSNFLKNSNNKIYIEQKNKNAFFKIDDPKDKGEGLKDLQHLFEECFEEIQSYFNSSRVKEIFKKNKENYEKLENFSKHHYKFIFSSLKSSCNWAGKNNPMEIYIKYKGSESDSYDFKATLKHELRHALGLAGGFEIDKKAIRGKRISKYKIIKGMLDKLWLKGPNKFAQRCKREKFNKYEDFVTWLSNEYQLEEKPLSKGNIMHIFDQDAYIFKPDLTDEEYAKVPKGHAPLVHRAFYTAVDSKLRGNKRLSQTEYEKEFEKLFTFEYPIDTYTEDQDLIRAILGLDYDAAKENAKIAAAAFMYAAGPKQKSGSVIV